ncbi:MAG: adenylate/guanylate cyclase domain-containing protein [Gammaproteobacteria bacterium]|nr:adenylate/guanylate cyclase domain-containing protein [Gammaproteobacteria bacterium]
MNITSKFQISAYYLLSVIVLCVFAFRSFDTHLMDSGFFLVLLVALPFVLLRIIREKLEALVVINQRAIDQSKRQLLLDLVLFGVAAIAIVVLQIVFQESTLLLSMKIFIWTMIIGYFASIDSALHRVRKCFSQQEAKTELQEKTVSIAHRLNIFLSLTVLFVAIAVALSAYSYMSISADTLVNKTVDVRQNFLVDTLFILGIVVSLTTRVIFSYSLNVQNLFGRQMDILRKVQRGDFNDNIPVLTRDEFGIIAQQTNKMIEELRDKDKIQKTLERIVSPDIMNKLLNGNAAALKQGEEHEIAILFCDLRKFTTYAENTPPEEVIFFLNAYFTKIADVVAEHNGIVNKFMGDAILAVFGVGRETGYVEQAVDAAWDILQHSNSARMRDGTTFDIGIGVHKGRAAAGTIGSVDRFEYTFIGDAVNTASRLDGLSKRLNHKIIISGDVYEFLSHNMKSRFVNFGKQNIRGKSVALQVYGAAPRTTERHRNVVGFQGKQQAGELF